MKKQILITLLSAIAVTVHVSIMHYRTRNIIEDENRKQIEIDSLKKENDFLTEMNLKFIENNETDPIGVRVEVRKTLQND